MLKCIYKHYGVCFFKGGSVTAAVVLFFFVSPLFSSSCFYFHRVMPLVGLLSVTGDPLTSSPITSILLL